MRGNGEEKQGIAQRCKVQKVNVKILSTLSFSAEMMSHLFDKSIEKKFIFSNLITK